MASKLTYPGQDANAPAGKAKYTIDLKVALFAILSALRLEVITCRGLVDDLSAQAIEDIEVGEPTSQEKRDFVFSAQKARPTTDNYHLTSNIQMVLPRNRYSESVGRDNFQRGKHYCSC